MYIAMNLRFFFGKHWAKLKPAWEQMFLFENHVHMCVNDFLFVLNSKLKIYFLLLLRKIVRQD